MTESEIYVRQLLPKKHGYPLWCPKPPDDLPSEYQADGVTIGDVGAITEDGVFDRIFNIFSPAEDLALPSGFEQMTTPANVLDQEDWRSAGDYIASTRMEKTRLDLDISSPANPYAFTLLIPLTAKIVFTSHVGRCQLDWASVSS